MIDWTIVVPMKALPEAKTRLASASADPSAHAGLVAAIRADTLRAAADVGRILLVVDRMTPDISGWPVLVQSGPGLNQALREAAAHVVSQRPSDGVAALVGDLPALRSEELRAALALAAEHPRAFVIDANGQGTTLLTALPGCPLEPAFGPDSATRHARAATAVAAGAGLRLDVDTASDLDRARELGLGSATIAELRGAEVNRNRA